MSRNMPTNTLIVTNVDDAVLKDPATLVRVLATRHLTCELICLSAWKRILLIGKAAVEAAQIRSLLEATPPWSSSSYSYSIRDNNIAAYEVDQEIDYLELPTEDGSKRFLISPPLSPPAEWEHWDKVEDHPHNKPMYNPDELTHLLWERLGGFNSSHVRKLDDPASQRDLNIEPQVLFEGVDEGCPVIVLDQADGDEPVQSTRIVGKTSLPPT